MGSWIRKNQTMHGKVTYIFLEPYQGAVILRGKIRKRLHVILEFVFGPLYT